VTSSYPTLGRQSEILTSSAIGVVACNDSVMAIRSLASVEKFQEFLSGETCLNNDGREGSAIYFFVTRDDHQFSVTSQHHMASSLPS